MLSKGKSVESCHVSGCHVFFGALYQRTITAVEVSAICNQDPNLTPTAFHMGDGRWLANIVHISKIIIYTYIYIGRLGNLCHHLMGVNRNQDTLDHDKAQKSAASGRPLHWIFLIFLQWIFSLVSRLKLPDCQAEKESVESSGKN